MSTIALAKIAFVFPGQGSQSVGMLKSLAEGTSTVIQTFEEASDAVGLDLWQLAQEGPAETLNQTENTQPALLAAGVAVWRVWQERGGQSPALFAGHSLGEYSALVASDALSLADGARLVAERGRLMQDAVPVGQGAMAAILGLDDESVRVACEQAAQGEVVSAANLNAPGQVVIAGTADAVERAIGVAKEAGAKRAIALPVSVPSHCALMKSAAERLAHHLAEIEMVVPRIPVIQNADVEAHDSPIAIGDALMRQLYQPVRWVETIRKMSDQGIETVVECGPGKVLAGLNRRINKSLSSAALFDNETIDGFLEQAAAGVTQ